jgi:2'-5' RNA ligase
MGVAPNGSSGPGGLGENLYALVVYIPDPLGRFLDNLRREMLPRCNPHAHVSVLPPRPLEDVAAAIGESRRAIARLARFEVELGAIEVFPASNVIYINLARGAEHLRGLHEALNRGALAFCEPFQYHPHVTLAQGIDQSQVDSLRELAATRWREFRGPRSFLADHAVFVRNICGDKWMDLEVEPLGTAPVG